MASSLACPCCQAPLDSVEGAPGRVVRCRACRAFLRVDPDGQRARALRRDRATSSGSNETAALIASPAPESGDVLEALRRSGKDTGRVALEARIADLMARRSPLDTYDIEMMKIRSTVLSGAPVRGEASPNRTGPYQLGEEIGRAPASVVYRATDTRGGPDRAIKVLLARDASDARIRRLFEIEIDSIRTLVHPNLVRVLESGEYEGHLCYAMELVLGRTYDRFLEVEPGLEQRAAALVQALEGVAVAHAAGLHHGNLKPSNILVGEAGEVRASDFALILGSGGSAERSPYAAPEANRPGEGVGPESDVYSAGAVLYHAITGAPPGPRPGRPRRLDPRAPAALEDVCWKAISPRPGERYPDAQELAADLARALEGRPVISRGWFARWWRR